MAPPFPAAGNSGHTIAHLGPKVEILSLFSFDTLSSCKIIKTINNLHHTTQLLLLGFKIMMASRSVYCICGEPYDSVRFMIQCDSCKDWYHGR